MQSLHKPGFPKLSTVALTGTATAKLLTKVHLSDEALRGYRTKGCPGAIFDRDQVLPFGPLSKVRNKVSNQGSKAILVFPFQGKTKVCSYRTNVTDKVKIKQPYY